MPERAPPPAASALSLACSLTGRTAPLFQIWPVPNMAGPRGSARREGRATAIRAPAAAADAGATSIVAATAAAVAPATAATAATAAIPAIPAIPAAAADAATTAAAARAGGALAAGA
eukprot:7233921-Prymnesium_polylepis.2